MDDDESAPDGSEDKVGFGDRVVKNLRVENHTDHEKSDKNTVIFCYIDYLKWIRLFKNYHILCASLIISQMFVIPHIIWYNIVFERL